MRDHSEADDTREPEILLYGTSWCGHSRRTQRLLDQQGITYQYIDIDRDPAAEALVMEINGGFRSVPTLVFPDGSTLTEPSAQKLLGKLTR